MLHRRVVRDVYAGGSSDHRIHYYFNENWQLLEERKEVSSTIDADPLNQYIWHPYYIDALAVRIYDADTDANVAENADGLYYYQHDANFNVTAATNLSGAVVERYKYTPYGKVTILDANFANDSDGISDIGNTHFYTGRELDPETGLQLNRWRFYASWLGRWVTRDPIKYRGSQWNLYEYVSNSPLIGMDPSGLVKIRCECTGRNGYNGWPDPYWVTISPPPNVSAETACAGACGNKHPVYDVPTGNWQVDGAQPDRLNVDICEGNWETYDFPNCLACCIKSYDFWKSAEAATGVLAFRIKKRVVHPGQLETNTWLYRPRRCLPRKLRPTLQTTRLVGRVSLFTLIGEGIYDLGAEGICTLYCSFR